jgi:G protein beta subunit-like protein
MGGMTIQSSESSSDTEDTSSNDSTPESLLFATAGYEHSIYFWDLYTGACYRTIQHPDPVNALKFTPDKSYLGTAGHPNIKLYDLKSQKPTPIITLEGHKANVTSFGFYNKCVYSGGEDGTVRLWDLRTSRCQLELRHPETMVNSVALHPNECELAAADQASHLRIWDLKNHQCLLELTPEETIPIRSIAFSNDGTILVACNNRGRCFVWNVTKTDKLATLPIGKMEAHNTYILKCALSPDQKWIATTSADKKVKIWSMDTFKLQCELNGHQKWVWDCAFSSDATHLVTASSDHTARMWNIEEQKCTRVFTGHHKAIVCLALHDSSSNL